MEPIFILSLFGGVALTILVPAVRGMVAAPVAVDGGQPDGEPR